MESMIMAIDGDSASGKTTLAQRLAKIWQQEFEGETVNIIHMDHFFLPKDLRTDSRLAEPGGNVHYERFKSEVLIPLLARRPFSYRPFDCTIMDFAESIHITPGKVNIIEGSYSHHPVLSKAYNLKVFLEIEPEEQLKRITARNGPQMAEKFKNIWIPLEKAYHKAFSIKENSNLIYKHTDL